MLSLCTKVTPELIHAARQGNLLAYNLLIAEYQDTIYNLVCRLLPADMDADAGTQMVVQRLYRDLPGFRGGDFRLWLLKILVKVCRPAMNLNHASTISNQYLIDSLANLPPNFRLVIVLVDMEGLDYAQTAAVLGISKRTVRAHLARARQHILDASIHCLEKTDA